MSETTAALPDWARAHAGPLFPAEIRKSPQDFKVDEILGFEPSGDGEHDLLLIRKTGTNTAWLARQLARVADVPARDVGYAGLKDRNAETTQWFSVRRPSGAGTDWSELNLDGVNILEQGRNARKLRRGAHTGNQFRIALRGSGVAKYSDELRACIDAIRAAGIPNYFGEQRFGHDGGNLDLARSVFAGKRVKREKRNIAISAARSLIFNNILDRRVREGSWDSLRTGDVANLNGTGSVFEVEHVTQELVQRCADFDIHPTASLWGKAAPCVSFEVADLETEVAARNEDLASGLVGLGAEAASRSLRVVPSDLEASVEKEVVWLSFGLQRGSYATAVLREIVETV